MRNSFEAHCDGKPGYWGDSRMRSRSSRKKTFRRRWLGSNERRSTKRIGRFYPEYQYEPSWKIPGSHSRGRIAGNLSYRILHCLRSLYNASQTDATSGLTRLSRRNQTSKSTTDPARVIALDAVSDNMPGLRSLMNEAASIADQCVAHRRCGRYRLRLSGPLLDRIDLQVYVRPVPLRELRRPNPGESSAQIRARVAAARDRQLARLRPWNLRCNAEMPVSVQRATCKLDSLGERTLAELVERRRTVTARSVDRLIKVA